MNTDWEVILEDRLTLFGHRNWLVIADSAYPAQSKAGIETVAADEEQIPILEKAHTILSASKHITATVYMDQELMSVSEEDAPGIGPYVNKVRSLLAEYVVNTLPHDEIISKLDRIADKFRVLLIKSNLRIPYTSVFFELECGYWSAEAEQRLRQRMQSVNRSAENLRLSVKG